MAVWLMKALHPDSVNCLAESRRLEGVLRKKWLFSHLYKDVMALGGRSLLTRGSPQPSGAQQSRGRLECPGWSLLTMSSLVRLPMSGTNIFRVSMTLRRLGNSGLAYNHSLSLFLDPFCWHLNKLRFHPFAPPVRPRACPTQHPLLPTGHCSGKQRQAAHQERIQEDQGPVMGTV